MRGYEEASDGAQIACADCLDALKDVPDGAVDMILCDPPYGTTSNKWDSVIPLDELWEEYLRIAKEDAAIVLFSQQPFTSELVKSRPDLFRYEWIWSKPQGTGFLQAGRMPLKAHENICVFYRKLPTYNPQFWQSTPYRRALTDKSSTNYRSGLTEYESKSDGKRFPVDIVSFNFEHGLHPTQKPVPLCEYLIRTYTHPGETVLDNAMGSGTTGVACVNTDRRFIGIELDAGYYEIARRRITEAAAQGRLFAYED